MVANLPTNILGFVLVLGLVIFVHESGHFFVAKMFGVRVLVFSFGFGKRLFGFRRGDTDYRVSLIPLGGYVRMAGDTPEENQVGAPDEFLSKPKWQRFLILLAGPVMNVITAIILLAIINMAGTEIRLTPPVIGQVEPGYPAAAAGLQVGDRIASIKGEKVQDFDDVAFLITMHSGTPLKVEYYRNGQFRQTILTPRRVEGEYGPIGRAGIRPFYEPLIGRVDPGSIAAKAGLRPGDRIVAVNGTPIRQMLEFDLVLEKSNNKAIALTLQRGPQQIQTQLAATALDPKDPYRGFLPPTQIRKLALGPALDESVQQNWKMLRYAGVALARMFRPEGSVKELSGPISIAAISGEMLRRGWRELIALMGMISLQLGILNLLPIPILDGGHIMILAIEGAARRELSLQVKERILQVGFFFIAMLMIVVLYHDVVTHVFLRPGG